MTAANNRTFQQSAAGPSPISKLSYSATIKVIKAKMKKAPGIDMVTNWMLVWGESALRVPLLSLFENMWKNNVVPVGIAQARVAYIYEGKGPMAEISGYTGPSLSSPALGNSTLCFGSGLWWSRSRPTHRASARSLQKGHECSRAGMGDHGNGSRTGGRGGV